MGGNVNYYKSVHHAIPTLPVLIGNTLVIFKTNQYALLLIKCPGIFFSGSNWREEEGLFWRVQEGGPHCEITPKTTWLLVVIRDEKFSPFVKFEIILPLLCFSLDDPTNKSTGHGVLWQICIYIPRPVWIKIVQRNQYLLVTNSIECFDLNI